MSIHPYKHMHTHFIPMSTSKRLSQLDIEIYEVGYQDYLAVDRNVGYTKKIISHKYNTHVKYRI
jgi:hypothetical protein